MYICMCVYRYIILPMDYIVYDLLYVCYVFSYVHVLTLVTPSSD